MTTPRASFRARDSVALRATSKPAGVQGPVVVAEVARHEDAAARPLEDHPGGAELVAGTAEPHADAATEVHALPERDGRAAFQGRVDVGVVEERPRVLEAPPRAA